MKKLILSAAFAAAMCFQSLAQTSEKADLNRKTFEAVWSTVNKSFYDPKFNGVDWKAAHNKYLPSAIAAKSDEELYRVLTELLSLLKVSHMEAGPASAVKKLGGTVTTTGVGLRMVEGKLTITKLLPGFPAEKSGLKTGYIVTAIDGTAVSGIEDAKKMLAGESASKAKISYLDESGRPHTIEVERQPLSDKDRGKLAGLKFYALFDAKRLDGGIGYISFTSFIPFLSERISEAFVSMKDAPGMIIDLRGNAGGDDGLALGIANHLFNKPIELMVTTRRSGEDHDYKIKGTSGAYLGKLVILVDRISGSASEQLTAGLQEAGRAYVIGTNTAGEDLDADIKMLPDGGILVYAYGLPHTPKGVIIEGRGVIPDLIVEMKRSDLLAGHDTPLDAAIKYLLAK